MLSASARHALMELELAMAVDKRKLSHRGLALAEHSEKLKTIPYARKPIDLLSSINWLRTREELQTKKGLAAQLKHLHQQAVSTLRERGFDEQLWRVFERRLVFGMSPLGVLFNLDPKEYELFAGDDEEFTVVIAKTAAVTHRALKTKSKEEAFFLACELMNLLHMERRSYDYKAQQVSDGFLNQLKRDDLGPKELHTSFIWHLCSILAEKKIEPSWKLLRHHFNLAIAGKSPDAAEALKRTRQDTGYLCQINKLDSKYLWYSVNDESKPREPVKVNRIYGIIHEWKDKTSPKKP